jgi:hypothetical protein
LRKSADGNVCGLFYCNMLLKMLLVLYDFYARGDYKSIFRTASMMTILGTEQNFKIYCAIQKLYDIIKISVQKNF